MTLQTLNKLIELIDDESLKDQIERLSWEYNKIKKYTNCDVNKYPGVKKLEQYYIPELSKQTDRYSKIVEINGPQINDEQLELKHELMETICLFTDACLSVMEQLQEYEIIDTSAELTVLKQHLRMDGLLKSDFDVTFEKPKDTKVLKGLNNDPFFNNARESRMRKENLIEGYKPKYKLHYEYIADYIPMGIFNEASFSRMIDDLETNVEKAKDEVAKLIKKIIKTGEICIVPGAGYRPLIDVVRSLENEGGIVLTQVISLDLKEKKYVFNGEKSLINKDIILLDSICDTGDSFYKCRHILLEYGAASVRCIALARRMDQDLEFDKKITRKG